MAVPSSESKQLSSGISTFVCVTLLVALGAPYRLVLFFSAYSLLKKFFSNFKVYLVITQKIKL